MDRVSRARAIGRTGTRARDASDWNRRRNTANNVRDAQRARVRDAELEADARDARKTRVELEVFQSRERAKKRARCDDHGERVEHHAAGERWDGARAVCAIADGVFTRRWRAHGVV